MLRITGPLQCLLYMWYMHCRLSSYLFEVKSTSWKHVKEVRNLYNILHSLQIQCKGRQLWINLVQPCPVGNLLKEGKYMNKGRVLGKESPTLRLTKHPLLMTAGNLLMFYTSMETDLNNAKRSFYLLWTKCILLWSLLILKCNNFRAILFLHFYLPSKYALWTLALGCRCICAFSNHLQ